jgi:translation elongation factor P/translation initiation factor 5A
MLLKTFKVGDNIETGFITNLNVDLFYTNKENFTMTTTSNYHKNQSKRREEALIVDILSGS